MAHAHFVGIPYHGAAGQATDTMNGQLQFGLFAAPDALSRRNAGLRILAVTSAQRSPLAPDIPTVAESGLPGYEAELWHGLFAPAHTPGPIVERLSRALAAATRGSTTRSRLLVGELAGLGSTDEVAIWAQRPLGEKNNLTDEAGNVEAAFQAILTSLGARTDGASTKPDGAGEAEGAQRIGAGVDKDPDKAMQPARKLAGGVRRKATPETKGIDKSVLTIPEPRRIRDCEHIRLAGVSDRMSLFAVSGLKERGFIARAAERLPQQCMHADIETADHIVAVNKPEHRPLMIEPFPLWTEQIEYWSVMPTSGRGAWPWPQSTSKLRLARPPC
jgi:Tripartite tricarboxylate transporter family receptor